MPGSPSIAAPPLSAAFPEIVESTISTGPVGGGGWPGRPTIRSAPPRASLSLPERVLRSTSREVFWPRAETAIAPASPTEALSAMVESVIVEAGLRSSYLPACPWTLIAPASPPASLSAIVVRSRSRSPYLLTLTAPPSPRATLPVIVLSAIETAAPVLWIAPPCPVDPLSLMSDPVIVTWGTSVGP